MTTTEYFMNKVELAEFAAVKLSSLKPDCAWTTTIKPGRYAGYYVTSAIEESSGDTEVLICSKQPLNT